MVPPAERVTEAFCTMRMGRQVRVLIAGASGFIGSAILARLRTEGYETLACVRSDRDSAPGDVQVIDFAAATTDDWLRILASIDAVVNCVGVLQDSTRDSTFCAHATGAARLFAACEKAGVRRVIHFSALGVDRPITKFSETKRYGDEALMQRQLDWVILRPSVVVGPAAYGGSALFRGLAGLPLLPRLPASGPLQIVQLSDVVETVFKLLQPNARSRMVLDLAGPERLSVWEVVALFRGWLGWKRQPSFDLPPLAASLLYRLGDFAGWLGWRPPLRSTAGVEIVRGATGDVRAWVESTGIEPRALSLALLDNPSSVQERWFAKLYFIRPLLYGVLAFFWVATGLISLGPGWQIGMEILQQGRAAKIAPVAITAGALADIAIGIGIAFRRTTRIALYSGIVLSLAYAVLGTIVAPQLWSDPLGSMLKTWPNVVLLCVAIALLDDR